MYPQQIRSMENEGVNVPEMCVCVCVCVCGVRGRARWHNMGGIAVKNGENQVLRSDRRWGKNGRDVVGVFWVQAVSWRHEALNQPFNHVIFPTRFKLSTDGEFVRSVDALEKLPEAGPALLESARPVCVLRLHEELIHLDV